MSASSIYEPGFADNGRLTREQEGVAARAAESLQLRAVLKCHC